MKFVDIHCHPLKKYYDDPNKVVSHAIEKQMEHLGICGCTIKENEEVLKIISEFKKNTFGIIGIHPSHAFHVSEIDLLRKQINSNIKAIGEIGLDYSHEKNPPKAKQIEMLKLQIDLALSNNLPIVIHLRDAKDDLLEILETYKEKKLQFVIHTFSEDLEYAKKIYELGGYFSFSGVCTFKNAKKTQEVIKWLPIDRIFTETDSPYLTPFPHRGEINYPNYVRYILFYIAGLKDIPIDKLSKQIIQNTKRFFNLNVK